MRYVRFKASQMLKNGAVDLGHAACHDGPYSQVQRCDVQNSVGQVLAKRRQATAVDSVERERENNGKTMANNSGLIDDHPPQTANSSRL
ncbi:hypothetical protein H0H93_004619 [Arthromyces matolae]|nr:hypothetical protein H0H93_004619 [Arthromyces matolae]